MPRLLDKDELVGLQRDAQSGPVARDARVLGVPPQIVLDDLDIILPVARQHGAGAVRIARHLDWVCKTQRASGEVGPEVVIGGDISTLQGPLQQTPEVLYVVSGYYRARIQ